MCFDTVKEVFQVMAVISFLVFFPMGVVGVIWLLIEKIRKAISK